MMACSSPVGTSMSIPRRIGLPSISAVSPSIFNISRILLGGRAPAGSTDAPFEADLQQLLRLDRELHRQLLQHLAAEAVDDEADRVLLRHAALAAVEELVLGDAAGGRLVLGLRRHAAVLDVGHRVGAALVADQQAVALGEVARLARRR